MLHLFKSNGLRFYEGTGANLSFRNRKYALQTIPEIRIHACYRQPIDFSGISRVQAWSNSAVTLEVYSPTNVLLTTVAMPFSHVMGSYNIYNYTINWVAIGSLVDGSYLKITNVSSEVWYSEPFENAKSPIIKIQYSCNRDTALYGSFKKCFEHIMYVPAVLADYDRIEKQTTYLDSRIVNHVISHTSIPVAKLYTDNMPYYMHEILRDALCHDTIIIDNLAWQKTEEGYKTNHNLQSSIHSAECQLREASTAILRLASQRNLNAGASPILQPETNILSAGFTINWLDADADTYDVQLSTSPTFASIIFSINVAALTYTFTGLSQDIIYYYRVRSLSCAGTSDWSIDNVKTLVAPMAAGFWTEYSKSLLPISDFGYSNETQTSVSLIFKNGITFYSNGSSYNFCDCVIWTFDTLIIVFDFPGFRQANYTLVGSPIPQLLPDTFYNLILTRDNGLESLYLNNILIGTSSVRVSTSAPRFLLGDLTVHPGTSKKLEIFDFKVYLRILTNTERNDILQSNGLFSPPNAFIDVPFVESEGSQFMDISGNNNNMNMSFINPIYVTRGVDNHHIDEDSNPIL